MTDLTIRNVHGLKVADLSDFTAASVEEMAEFKEGDWVQYGDDQVGAVVSVMTENVGWPGEVPESEQPEEDDEDDDDDESDEGISTIAASSDNPIYIVARASGGSQPFREDDLTSISRDEAVGDLPDDVDPVDDVVENEDELYAPIYSMVDDPFDFEEFSSRLEELQNIPGVDDPHVGWDGWPASWEKSEKPARLIFLDMWTSVGATFTTCRAEFSGRVSRPSRFCASAKDEALRTERWRNRF